MRSCGRLNASIGKFFLFSLGIILFLSSSVLAVEIKNQYPSQVTFNISTTIEINASITDGDGIGNATVNVTYPNGTVFETFLAAQTGDKYNVSFTIPDLPGAFNLTFWANDTLGNTATNTSNFTGVFTTPQNIGGLQLWLDATDNATLFTNTGCTSAVASDSDEVACWRSKTADQSNSTVVSGKIGADYVSNASIRMSGETFLRFDKAGESVYETGVDIRANTTEDVTIFTVYRPRTTNVSDTGQAIWGNDDGSWDRFYYSLFQASVPLGTDGVDDGLISLGGASSGLAIDGAGIVNTTFLLTAVYDGNVSGGTNVGPTNASQIYFDGNLQVSFTDESHATAAQTQMFIGRDGDNGYYDGDVAEMIVYNQTLSACQLEIVNKYLSAKYGKDFFNVSGNYGFSAPHNNSVNGIAEVNGNCTATVEITSGQSSIATIFSPAELDLDDSLTFAHDSGGFSLFSEAPGNFTKRLNQSWRVDEDGEVGNVSVSFDLSSTTISPSSTFALIIDTNTNFSDASIHPVDYTVSGTVVTFTNVNLSNADYFSLAVEEVFDDPTSLTNLRAWYDATDNDTLYTDEACSAKVSAAGQDVRCWQDKSNYSANATNVSGKGIPTYITGEFNSLSVLNFSKSQQDTLRHTVPSQYTSNFSIFLVIQSKGDASTYDSFFSNGEPADSNHFQIDYTNDSGVNSFRYGASTKFNFETYSNDIKLYSVTHNSTFVKLYNEGQEVNNGSVTEGRVFEHYRINQNRNGNQHHHSKIAEIILYDRVLSDCEREKVNIYLGDKYGKDFFGLSDNYGFGSPHDHDTNGIGEFASSCATSKQFLSAQSSIATVSGASSLDNNDSLTFAHDEGGFTLNTQAPSSFVNRLNQSWRVDHDNDVGYVNISFDLSSTTISTLTSNFALLIDVNSNFSDANTTTTYTVSDGVVTFTNVSIIHGHYFSLAVNESAPLVSFVSPTPVNNAVTNNASILLNVSSNASGDDHYVIVEFNNSLLFWMRADDTNSSGDPLDSSGKGNNGTLVGGAFINSTGRFGDAFHLDGSGDYVNLPASNTLMPDDDVWTMGAWFNARSIGSGDQDNRIVTVSNSSSNSAFSLALGRNSLAQFFYRDQSGSGFTVNITTVQTDRWYHYIAAYNGTTYTVYIDGVLNASITASSSVISSNPARIGVNPAASSEYFNGSIDEVIVLRRALTATETLALYNASATQYERNFTFSEDGNYSFVGYAVGANGQKNQTEERTITFDTTVPQVFAITADPSSTYNLTAKINVTVNVTDLNGLDVVKTNITYPNGTVDTITMTLGLANQYNASFIASSLTGTYTALIIANDSGSNTNSSQSTTFQIQNDVPDPSSVEINGGSDITLTAASNKTIVGSATITDLNGFGHVANATGYLFLTSVGVGASNNRSNHYTTACTDNGDGSANTVSYNCSFNVSHFASPTDAGSNKSSTNWTFIFDPRDVLNTGTNGSDVVELNTLLAFNITPSIIDFGSLSLGQNTTNTNQEINVTNKGNVGIDVLVSGTNFSCTPGKIPVTFVEYEDDPFTYGVGTDVLETNIELDLDVQPGIPSNDQPNKTTYYGLGSPQTSVGGSCSGSVILTGQADPNQD